MSTRNFNDLLHTQWSQQRFLCVGLDPDVAKIPESVVGSVEERMIAFNRAVIDATHDVVQSYKPNSAFYEAHGDVGLRALRETIQYAQSVAPEVPIILDAKRADIGNTNNGYVSYAFDYLNVDAITVHPYMGGESLAEFFARADKGIFVMCKNSNLGSGEFQDLEINGEPLYLHLARAFATTWNANNNCGLVVGATYPADISRVRAIAPAMPLLIPGVGAQGGDLEASVKAARNIDGGFILSTSRAVLYVSSGTDFADVARTEAQKLDAHIRAAL
jgi:orotidine-5'-phosphate decarboxylase